MDTILKYFTLTGKQKQQFEQIGNLYPEWNAKINVISRKDIDNLWVNHILHSLAIAKFINPVTGTTFLDMGTGGGFPGIPLAIMWPECKLHLIDRIGKKIKVAQDIAQQIGLDNVTFQHGDIGECRNTYDFVVSRAVMRLDELLPLIKKNVSRTSRNAYPNGLICLKGGDLSSELHGIKNPVIEEPLNRYFDEPFFETKKLIYVQI
ncbi:16S rRNA (guanine(527)-N(7))-methyltransferase RsmG [uncultured Muribaculum sp.]|uniref:16S rRNA (guanine(527)-N(7))-methyltransferase RsmG n=1 Tax=uncultured Muribaculum sp. TaxID=1918613 RepID=UPI0025B034F9|nr:16S rRNA (guanine(527)-N(7))-methyltransferase RsmG [uncultured Muribaculum sp.]